MRSPATAVCYCMTLNIAVGYLGFCACMSLLMRSARPACERVGLTLLKLVAGFYIATGGIIGAMLALLDGWLFGSQAFLMGGAAVVLAGCFLKGLTWLLMEVVGPWIGWIVAYPKTTPVGLPLRLASRFFNPPQDDDPYDPPEGG